MVSYDVFEVYPQDFPEQKNSSGLYTELAVLEITLLTAAGMPRLVEVVAMVIGELDSGDLTLRSGTWPIHR